MDAEAGGEDERGEGDDLGSKGEREEPAAARKNTDPVKVKILLYPVIVIIQCPALLMEIYS